MFRGIADALTGSGPLRRMAVAVKERFFYRMSAPNPRKTHRNLYVVSTTPLIVVTSEGAQDLEILSEAIGDVRAHIVVAFWWSKETLARAGEVHHFYTGHRARYPLHEVTFMCNTPGEHALLERLGVPAVYCNQNCLLDEAKYRIVEGVAKQ